MAVAARTDVGRVRTVNEDALVVADLDDDRELAPPGHSTTAQIGGRRILLALSDGMGGHEAGEVASAVVLTALVASLRERASAPPDRALEEAVHAANTAVLAAAKARNNNGMGATLTAVLVQDGDAWIAEVGDSRAYLLRGDQLRQVTRDQSLVQMLVDGGAMTPTEAKTSTRKNVILQAMGKSDQMRVAISRLALRRGDRLLLCSDGVSNAIPDAEMATIVLEEAPQPGCVRLIDLANERGGEDNATAVIAHFDGKGLTGAPQGETVTSTFAVLQAFDERSPRKPATAPMPTVSAPPPTTTPAAPTRAPAGRATAIIVVALVVAAIVAVAIVFAR